MTFKYILDTNFILRLLVKDNEVQLQEIVTFIEKTVSKNEIMLIDKSVFFELCFVLTGKIYQLSRSQFNSKIQEIIDLNCFEFEDFKIIIETLKIYTENNLDIVDCYLIAKAKQENFEFKTFDTKANKIFKELTKK
jgi:predicted nucleic acid-binding protein